MAMMRTSPPDESWAIIPRTRFGALWATLPPLTVLASLPGWGRTEWLRQCRAACENRGEATVWITSRRDLEAALATGITSGTVVLVDEVDLAVDDQLWPRLAAAGDARIVVACSDPPLAMIDRATVLDERDLRFDADEVSAVIEANAVTVASDARDELSESLRGCPDLVRRQIERLRTRRAQGVWASVAPDLTRSQIVEILGARSLDRTPGTLMDLLRRGAKFRRFSARLLTQDAPAETPRDDGRAFERLGALPFGELDIDDETGERDFVWSTPVWLGLDAAGTPLERRADVASTLPTLRRDGRVTGLLHPLLELGRVEEAEALVFDHHRRFLLFCDAPTQELLLGFDGLGGYPSLLLLTAELRLRRFGANAQITRDAVRCWDAFAPAPTDTDVRRFRLACRRAMAAAYSGRRSATVRQLAAIADLLDVTAGSSVRRAADDDRGTADQVAADLFLAFWAAVQTDQHDIALNLIRVSFQYGDPADAVTEFDRLTAITEEDFAGTRSLDATGERPGMLEYSHAAALVMIEEGDDLDALRRTHPLASRVRPAPTRSAADALLILARALAAPGRLERRAIDATLRRSAEFWDDREPSSFIAFAAVVAHLAVGRIDDARAVVASVTTVDWFTLTARGLTELATGASDSALSLFVSAAETTTLPRLELVARVLQSAALVSGGFAEAAGERLAVTWESLPAPRLVRFALRFVDDDVFEALRGATPSGALRDVLESAAGDSRAARIAPPGVSAAERDILRRLQRGQTNVVIAAERAVSLNTVRTQLRLLYRKLGVSGRAEAIAAAERHRLLETD